MKAIFKIEEHLPDTKQISVKICKAKSHKSIDDYAPKLVNYSDLDLSESGLFVDGLLTRHGLKRIESQENKQPILDSNKSESISGSVNLDDLVGKVIEGTINVDSTSILKMRRVEL